MASYLIEPLRLRVKRKANMENSDFVETDELDEYINESYKELFELMALEGSDRYLLRQTFTLSGDAADNALLPDNGTPMAQRALSTDAWEGMLVLRAVDKQDGDEWLAVYPFDMKERSNTVSRGPADVGYILAGHSNGYRSILIMPEENLAGTYRVFFIAIPADISITQHSVDLPSNWVQYIVVDSAIKCLVKEESDPAALLIEKAALIERIKKAERSPEGTFPKRVIDVTTGANFSRRLF